MPVQSPLPADDSYQDVKLWELIRTRVESGIESLVEGLEDEVPKDDLLRASRNQKGIGPTFPRILEQRANSWIERFYDLACAALPGATTPASDRAIYTFVVRPFIDKHLYDLLLRALGIRLPSSLDPLSKLFRNFRLPGEIPPVRRLQSPKSVEVDERHLVTTEQRRCCEEVKDRVSRRWRAKLVPGCFEERQLAEATAAMAQADAQRTRATRIASGSSPEAATAASRIVVAPKETMTSEVDSPAPGRSASPTNPGTRNLESQPIVGATAPKDKRLGRRPDPALAQARLDIRAILQADPDSDVKDICDELTKQSKACPYAKTWDDGLAKRPAAVHTLVSKTKKDLENSQAVRSK
jgi:hypothetical protein